MDFDQAIQSHVEWKMKLTAYIRKPDHSLDPAKVCGDAGCPLGKWLKAEGTKFSSTPEYAQLMADHARFHQAAAEIIRRADAGEKMEGEVALGSKSEYARISSAVVSSLMKMKMKAA